MRGKGGDQRQARNMPAPTIAASKTNSHADLRQRVLQQWRAPPMLLKPPAFPARDSFIRHRPFAYSVSLGGIAPGNAACLSDMDEGTYSGTGGEPGRLIVPNWGGVVVIPPHLSTREDIPPWQFQPATNSST